ncbi:effector-associated domain EAD1-containing protein [Frankia sp. R82]|uniref:effector-associated domain EAD1-containing protein n=1 Tax=Frankia sp. R82 TaxID=2950553 RepID=UPI0020448D80|nr:effector-associated domain EAD1-containing protein [Frankia sp. R82]MCM3884327.1 effector-associated domain EAD1-containing protein [Frankia sp. R82]
MTQRLTEAEIEALATMFDTRTGAVQVLEGAGLGREQIPVFDGSPFQFWTEIAHLLRNGIIEDGRVRLLAAAAKRFPALPAFQGQPPAESAQHAGSGGHARAAGPAGWRAPTWGAAPGASRPASLFCVDARGYSSRDLHGQVDVRVGVREVIDTALDRADVSGAVLLRQESGDGCLCALDAAVPKDLLASDFVRELRIAQRQFNRVRQPEARVRLRLALHHGQILPEGEGAAGDAVVVVCRLADAAAVRTALDNHPEAELVLALSPDFYRDTVAEGLRDLDPADFALVPAVVGRKFVGDVWVTLPGHRTNPPVTEQPLRLVPQPGAQAAVQVAPQPAQQTPPADRPVRVQAPDGPPPPFPGRVF